MANCAFIDVFTTLNDLYSGHDCPIEFRCEVSSDETPGFEPQKVINVEISPDESILGNGTAFHGHTNGTEYQGLLTDEGLKKVVKVLNTLVSNEVYLIGYEIDKKLKNIAENSERVLGEKPRLEAAKTIDVAKIAHRKVDIVKCGNYHLGSVFTTIFGGKAALDDLSQRIDATRKILVSLSTGNNLKELYDFLNSPWDVEYFQVGKYKGMKIADVYEKDVPYLSWILANQKYYECDPDMIEKAKKLMESDGI